MSTFSGKMQEYKQISIDQFEGINLQSSVYFLSHCHTDHMKGLQDKKFYERLTKTLPQANLYCSQISKTFLLNDGKFSGLERYIIALPIGEATVIEIPREITKEIEPSKENQPTSNQVTITLIPAGHCPGSVMFLFEGNEGTVLYTGDIRFSIGSVQRMKVLHSGQDVKKIQSLYIDTTFCSPESLHIASREQSRDALINLTKNWISRSKNHVVYLKFPAQYGYEYLFVELYKNIKIKIHVDSSKLNKYSDVLEILDSVTQDRSTQIHTCFGWVDKSINCLPCGFSSENILVVKVSAIFFTRHVTIDDVVFGDIETGDCRLNFSTHSSLSEICDFISHLKPDNIYPTAVPDGKTSREIIELLTTYCGFNMKPPSSTPKKPKLLGLVKKNHNSDSPQENSNLIFDVDVYSPVKKIKIATGDSQESKTSSEVEQTPVWRLNCSSDSDETVVSFDSDETVLSPESNSQFL